MPPTDAWDHPHANHAQTSNHGSKGAGAQAAADKGNCCCPLCWPTAAILSAPICCKMAGTPIMRRQLRNTSGSQPTALAVLSADPGSLRVGEQLPAGSRAITQTFACTHSRSSAILRPSPSAKQTTFRSKCAADLDLETNATTHANGEAIQPGQACSTAQQAQDTQRSQPRLNQPTNISLQGPACPAARPPLRTLLLAALPCSALALRRSALQHSTQPGTQQQHYSLTSFSPLASTAIEMTAKVAPAASAGLMWPTAATSAAASAACQR